MTDHPITPPPEVVKQWITKYGNSEDPRWQTYEQDIATQAANWGWQQRDASVADELQKARDEELEACCDALRQKGVPAWSMLRAARRPKPKSLAEEGYDALDTYIYGNPDSGDKERTYNAIRRALERLQELELHDSQV